VKAAMGKQPADPIRDSGTRRSKSPDVRVQSICKPSERESLARLGASMYDRERNQAAEGRFVTPSSQTTSSEAVIQGGGSGRSLA
jgi:hypothetical protein